MNKCEVCGGDWDIKVDGKHIYCAKHYVTDEDDECLYWDLNAIMQGIQVGKSKESSEKILAEIKKKCHNHIKRYQKENQDTNSN